MSIKLVKETISRKEIDDLIEWLKTYPRLTKGELTIEYEKKWAEFLGCKHSVFVNSGSSANLLMLYCLIEMGMLERGDQVVVPAVSWATDLAPVVQLGLEPILCDCNLTDLSIDLEHFEKIINTHDPKCLLLVSVLGMVPKMDLIKDMCDKNDVILLEDACESLGSEYKGEKIGNFGLMSSFSTYYGHHMSTIEGGMVCTNNTEIYNILKSIRSHGWDRDLDEDFRQKLRNENNIHGNFESLYRFYHFGFNLRSTDLQAFLGLGQLENLSDKVIERNKNYQRYINGVDNDYWQPQGNVEDVFISNFCFPVITPRKNSLVKNLVEADVEVRPLICGSMTRQPVWQKLNKKADCPNAEIVDQHGVYVPNNSDMTEAEIDYIVHVINRSVK